MRLTCPNCGERDLREFYYKGDAAMLMRPSPDAGVDEWDAFVHLRDNPAGEARELWFHESGCGAWIVVERDTLSHEIAAVALVKGGLS